jgi:hypothetical protein
VPAHLIGDDTESTLARMTSVKKSRDVPDAVGSRLLAEHGESNFFCYPEHAPTYETQNIQL